MSVYYPGIALVYAEVADQGLAALASITPTVSGIFTAVLSAAQLGVYIYSDAEGGWVTVTTGVTYMAGIAGQVNKISFKNEHLTNSYWIVVGKFG